MHQTEGLHINYGPDYSATLNHFWDWRGSGYGNETDNDFDFADMNGGGSADIVKVGKNGDFRIDYSENGLGSWDMTKTGYGDATKNAFICADLNGGGKADLFKISHYHCTSGKLRQKTSLPVYLSFLNSLTFQA